jgi:hypothetical protein
MKDFQQSLLPYNGCVRGIIFYIAYILEVVSINDINGYATVSFLKGIGKPMLNIDYLTLIIFCSCPYDEAGLSFEEWYIVISLYSSRK